MKRMFTKSEIIELAKEASGNVVKVSNITAISTKILNALKPGDIILKKTGNMYHTYFVTYKEEKHGICISYFAAGYSETVSYDYVGSKWVYNSTDVSQAGSGGDSTLVLTLEMAGGTLTADELASVLSKPYNVVITFGEGTAYATPLYINYGGSTINLYVMADPNPLTLALVEINTTTGQYTLSQVS